ncbi:MAG TPA: phage tail tape measure protein [Polyangiales bacterium]|nr:phage tail tape measure protein [Polyangiales bacterium]
MPTLSLAIDARRARQGAGEFEQATGRVQRATTSALRSVTALAGGISAAFAARKIVTDAARFEQGLVGVGKTADLSGAALKALGQDVLELSTRIPVATEELLGIAQAAGQLGVTGSANILKFTDTVAKLGTASDLSGEAAATTLARLLNVTNESVSGVDRLASVIVRLGNEFAATESEIAAVGQRVAQSTAAFDVTSAQAVALGAALRSAGVEAELGGTEVGRAFRLIEAAVRDGGEELQKFGELTGKSGREFADAFKSSNIRGFQLFIDGLARVAAEGGSVSGTLQDIGLDGARSSAVFATLAATSSELGRALSTANDELSNTTALETEAARGADTLSGDWQRLLNTIKAVSVEAGDAGLLGALRDIVQTTSDVVRVLAGLETGFQKSRERAELLVSAVKAFSAALLTIPARAAAAAIAAIASSAAAATGSVTALAFATQSLVAFITGPVGIAVAVGAAVFAFDQLRAEAVDLKLELSEIASVTSEAASAQQAYNAALKDGAIDLQVLALRRQQDALLAVASELREVRAVAGSRAEAEFEVVANVTGLRRDEIEAVVARELGAGVDADLRFSDRVSDDLAKQILRVLEEVPEIDLGDRLTLGASAARIKEISAELTDLVKATGSGERAVALLLERYGVDRLPIEAALAAVGDAFDDLEGKIATAGTGAAAGALGGLAESAGKAMGELDRLGRTQRIVAASTSELGEGSQDLAGAFGLLGSTIARQTAEAAVLRATWDTIPIVFGVAKAALKEYRDEADQAARLDAFAELKRNAASAREELARLEESLRLEIVAQSPGGGVLEADLIRVRSLAQAAGEDADKAAERFQALFDELDALEQSRLFAEGIVDPIINGLDEAITRGKNLGEVLEDIARNIFRNLFNQLALQPLQESLVNIVQGAAGGLFSAKGNVFTPGFGGPQVVPFASGGILNGPVNFPLAGGRRGIAGEAGPEAIMPLERDGSGRLGVRSQGGGGQSIVFNITTPDADSFRRSERQIYRNAQRQLRGAG